ncbi:MAG: LacI family transcriptional regulator [Chloroflexi bacterium]|nr:LacI family transcriptional regulator [Chloroflexota bacterium]
MATVRMKDIARVALVSPSTVSRVLSGATTSVPIAPETRERVLRAVRELGYSPNPLARGLRGQGTALLGLISREINDPFLPGMIEAIINAAQAEGYNVVLGLAHSSAGEALALTRVLETRHCDGIILLGDMRDHQALLAEIDATMLPVVGQGHGEESPQIPTVNVDSRRGTREALSYLLELGHRRIAYVDSGWIGDSLQRRTTYFDFMAEHGLAVEEGYYQGAGTECEDGLRACQALLALPRPPTAIFAATDALAIGVLKAAWGMGLRVPSDLSVVGFDDVPMAEFVVPSLTTLRQPLRELARLVVQTLARRIDDPTAPIPAIQEIAPTLVVRESCAPYGAHST